ncbi:MAG: polyprenyl synthetase family protein [Bacteroidota bacterium]|nr:polyprenyl synthetase family protein [Bacteroidota bacterium]
MTKIEEITTCIHKDLNDFEKMFSDAFLQEKSALGSMLSYLSTLKGKRIRPMLTLLVAASFAQINVQTTRAAVIIELLHTASLLHDDVIDESLYRRNEKTLNAIWDNRASVLVGDYLYGKALSLIETKEDFNLMPVYAKIAMDLPKGEIREMEATNTKNGTIDRYLKIIYEKTASLIEASVMCGALSCGSKEIDMKVMQEFGHSIGMAFQIKDDLLDYLDNTGKEKGADIREKKMTLPFIYYMESIDKKEREETLSFLYSDKKEERQIENVIERISLSGAVERAQKDVEYYNQKARNIASHFPTNVYSTSLTKLVEYLTERNI